MARKAHADFVSKWKSRCRGVVKSLGARFCSRKSLALRSDKSMVPKQLLGQRKDLVDDNRCARPVNTIEESPALDLQQQPAGTYRLPDRIAF